MSTQPAAAAARPGAHPFGLRRHWWSRLLGILFCLAVSHSCYAESLATPTPDAPKPQRLSLIMWVDSLSPDLISAWEKETGVAIELTYIDNDEERDRLIAGRHSSDVDITVVDSSAAKIFARSGKFLRLDEDKLPNLRHMEPRLTRHCGPHAIPYAWGTLGLVYRRDKLTTPPNWHTLMQPPQALHGHIGMLADSVDMLVPPLRVLGYPPFSAQQKELKSAFELLKAQEPAVLAYAYAPTFVQNHSRGKDLYLAMGYSGDDIVLNYQAQQSDLWAYTVPAEGSLQWTDCLAVMEDSPHKLWASYLLNWLNEPENAAISAEYLGSTANTAALERLPAELKAQPSFRFADLDPNREQPYEELEEAAQRLRFRLRSAVMRLHETR